MDAIVRLLREIIEDEGGGKQRVIADKIEMSAPQVNRVLNGESGAGPDFIHALIGAFPKRAEAIRKAAEEDFAARARARKKKRATRGADDILAMRTATLTDSERLRLATFVKRLMDLPGGFSRWIERVNDLVGVLVHQDSSGNNGGAATSP